MHTAGLFVEHVTHIVADALLGEGRTQVGQVTGVARNHADVAVAALVAAARPGQLDQRHLDVAAGDVIAADIGQAVEIEWRATSRWYRDLFAAKIDACLHLAFRYQRREQANARER